jgi:hypothetical protein
MREIQVWSRQGTIDDEVAAGENPREIERISVHSITSPDLRGSYTIPRLSLKLTGVLKRISSIVP